MKRNVTPQKIREYTDAHRQKKRRRVILSGLAAVVVFCTAYALILPAITLEKERTLECSYEVHQHEEDCYDADGNVICGYADYVVHTHDTDTCYDETGSLVCELEELEEHVHSSACYEEQAVLACGLEESAGHVHSEACYAYERGGLICENTEEDHEHTDECYEWIEIRSCGMEEGEGAHAHTDACYETKWVRTCEKQEGILHTHTEDCYDADGALICGRLQVEEHQHDSGCFVEQTDKEASLEEAGDIQKLPVAPNGAVISAYVIVEEKTDAVQHSMAYGISTLSSGDETEDRPSLAENLTLAEIWIDGEKYDSESGSKVDKSKKFVIKLTSSIQNNGTQYVYEFPDGIQVEDTSETALMYDNKQIGKYWIKDNVLYVDYEQQFNSVTTNYEISATWSDTVGDTTTIQWNDNMSTDVVFQNEDIRILKTDNSNYKLVTSEDGGLYIEYVVQAQVTGGGTLDITDSFQDSFRMAELWEGAYEDGDGKAYDYRLAICTLDEAGNKQENRYQYGEFTVSEDGKTLTVADIELKDGEYAELTYRLRISPEDRAKLDAGGTFLTLANRAAATAVPEGETTPISDSVLHNATYSPDAGWIQKTPDSASGEGKNDGWSITVNYNRTANMDGFALLDNLQSGADGYDTESFQLRIQGAENAETVGLTVIDVQEKITELAKQNITEAAVTSFLTELFGTISYAENVEQINAYLKEQTVNLNLLGITGTGDNGAVTLTDLSGYVFVDNGASQYTATYVAPLFFWFSPESSKISERYGDIIGASPYSYTILYDTTGQDTDSPVGVVNSAEAAWRGVVTGTGPVFSNPQVQLTKSNGGVYEGEDGGMYVDWTIQVIVPEDSASLADVWLVDTLPTAKVTVAGVQYDTMPTLQGMKEYTLDASKVRYDNGEMTDATKQYLSELVGSSTFKITVSDSEAAAGQLTRATAMLGAPQIAEDKCFMAYEGAAAKLGTMYLENYPGYSSVSPRVFSIHLGDLPDTAGEDGYTVTVNYTTKVNPNTMPLATQNYVEAVNTVALYSKLDGINYTKLASSESEYWLAKQEAEDSVVKNIVSYDVENRVLTYRVQIDPLNNLEVGSLVYQLHDVLSDYPGAQYIEDSFRLYVHAKVVSGKYNQNNSFWKYDSSIEHLIWSSSTEDTGYLEEIIPNDDKPEYQEDYKTQELYDYLIESQEKEIPIGGVNETVTVTPLELAVNQENGEYTLTLCNTGWMSTTLDEGTKVVPMTLEYQVELPADTSLSTVINNQVTFTAADLSLPGVTALIGVSRASYDTEDILNKSMLKTPNSANGYTAQFSIVVGRKELEDKIKENTPEAELTEIVIHDTVENLIVDTFSAKLAGYLEDNGEWVEIDGSHWSLSIDPEDPNELTVTIRDVDDAENMPYTRYRLLYSASVDGVEDENVHYSNTASMDVEGVSDSRVEEEVYIQKNNSSSEIVNLSINLVKVDGNNASEAMEGVEFELYTYDGAAGTWERQETESTLTTDETSKIALINGQNNISLEYGAWYCLKETKPGDGYRLADPVYFYIKNPDAEGAPADPVSGVESGTAWPGGTGLDSGDSQIVYNFKPYFRVEKYEAGTDVRIWDGVEFTLYENEECTEPVMAPKQSTDGIFTFSGLDMDKTYYLRETGIPSGYVDPDIIYKIVIDKSGGVTFSSTEYGVQEPMEGHRYSFRVDNTKRDSFRLPETGGTGTAPFTLSGLLLMAGAAGYRYGLRRRRERRRK